MNILGCLDRRTTGAYRFAGRATASGSTPTSWRELRREHFGFIFQRYHLLPDASRSGNVEMPAIYAGVGAGPCARRARGAAARAARPGRPRMHHRPSQLSGGQQQRVSIARALMNGGEASSPTSPPARSTASGEEVMALLGELNAEGHTIILVTHASRRRDTPRASHRDLGRRDLPTAPRIVGRPGDRRCRAPAR